MRAVKRGNSIFMIGVLDVVPSHAQFDPETAKEFVDAVVSHEVDLHPDDIRTTLEPCTDGHVHFVSRLLKLPIASRARGKDFPMPNFFARR
jgi:hypothetical protein